MAGGRTQMFKKVISLNQILFQRGDYCKEFLAPKCKREMWHLKHFVIGCLFITGYSASIKIERELFAP